MAESMQKYIGKKYRLKSSENFDEYLKFIGVGLIGRKTACAVTPTCVLTRDGDRYTFTMSTTFRTITFSFKFNEEFEEERPDGYKVKSVVTVDGDVMTHTQVETNGRKSVHTRTFSDNQLATISTADGWNNKCVRIYEAVP